MSGEHPFFEDVEDWFLRRHHLTSAAPAAAAVTISTSTPGGPVSLATVKNFFHNGLAELEKLDEEAVNGLDHIAASPNPAVQSIFASLQAVTHVPDPMGILNSIDNLLKAFIPAQGAATDLPSPPAEPSFTPAGPQVGGQA